jgi:hypothetical protein
MSEILKVAEKKGEFQLSDLKFLNFLLFSPNDIDRALDFFKKSFFIFTNSNHFLKWDKGDKTSPECSVEVKKKNQPCLKKRGFFSFFSACVCFSHFEIFVSSCIHSNISI